MHMNKIIALAGMTGSGKTAISDYLANKGYLFLRFGQITLDILKDKGLELNEANEKKIREDVRKKYGMGAYATLNIPKFDEFIKKGNVIADGLYSWSEYKILKERYGSQLIVISVFSPPIVRYARLEQRTHVNEDSDMKNRPLSKEHAKSRDFAEIENLEKGGPIAMADFTIINIGTKEELINNLNEILKEIKKLDGE